MFKDRRSVAVSKKVVNQNPALVNVEKLGTYMQRSSATITLANLCFKDVVVAETIRLERGAEKWDPHAVYAAWKPAPPPAAEEAPAPEAADEVEAQ